jgi:hypothetical protein
MNFPGISPTTEFPAHMNAPATPDATPANPITAWEEHAQTPSQYIGNNSPTKRVSTSGVWKDVKRLMQRHPLDVKNDKTHICCVKITDGPDGITQYCNALLTLHKNKPKDPNAVRSWITTKAAEHLKVEHPVDSAAGQESVLRAEKAAE